MVETMKNGKNFSCVQNVKTSALPCKDSSCRHNLNSERYQSCAIIAAEDGPLTLQEIGDFYGISRMRVCQIEKTILKKLKGQKNQKNKLSDFDPLS